VRRRARGLVVAIVIGLALAVPAIVAAASPLPSGDTGDTRSSGQGPGLVGAPGAAILAVVAIGLAAVLLTLVYVRLTSRERSR
jgi:multisubunit Na+/H+ antiporter MnhB subunit